MKCPNRPADLVDFAQGIIPPEASALIARHVDTCPTCKSEVAELKAIFSGMKSRRLQAPPVNYWPSLLPRIHERLGERTLAARFLKGAPVLLPAVVVVSLVFFLTRFDTLVPMYDTQELHAIIHQMTGESLQEVDQNAAFEESSVPGRLSLAVDAPTGTDKEILVAIFQDGESTEGYSDLDQVPPESSISDDEAGELVARMQSNI
jgi:hypothetical protein